MQVNIYSNFNSLPNKYTRIYDRAEGITFDQTLPWFEIFSTIILSEDTEKLQIYAVEKQDSTALGFLPVYKTRISAGPFKFNICSSLSNYYTANYDAVMCSDANIKMICDYLANSFTTDPDGWHWLDINPVNIDSPFFNALSTALKKNGFYVIQYFRFANWYLDVNGRTFEEYFSTLPTALRNLLRRKRQKLEKETDIQVKIISSTDELELAMKHYWCVYENCWKPAEPYRHFINKLADRFCNEGWLRLGILYVNGQPAAVQMWFVFEKTASIFKLAYDKQFKQFSVGSILTMEMMKYTIDVDHVNCVDYLLGDDKYKRNWMSSRRKKWGIRAYRSKLSISAAKLLRPIQWAMRRTRSLLQQAR